MTKKTSTKSISQRPYYLVILMLVVVQSLLLIRSFASSANILAITPNSPRSGSATLSGILEYTTLEDGKGQFYLTTQDNLIVYLDKHDLDTYLNQSVTISGVYISPVGAIPGYMTVNTIKLNY